MSSVLNNRRAVYRFASLVCIVVAVWAAYQFITRYGPSFTEMFTRNTPAVPNPSPTNVRPQKIERTSQPTPKVKSGPSEFRASAPITTPEPAQPTVQTTPNSVYLPIQGVKEIGENRWLVTVYNREWFDTGIPVIANQEVSFRKQPNMNWSAVFGRHRISSNQTLNSPIVVGTYERQGEPYDFQQTIKLIAENVSFATVEIRIRSFAGCPYRERNSPHQHDSFIAWAEEMKQRLRR